MPKFLNVPISLDVPVTPYWLARIPGLADNVRQVTRRTAPIFARVRRWQAVFRDCLTCDLPPTWPPKDLLQTEPSYEAFLRRWVREHGPRWLTPEAFSYAQRLSLLPDAPWRTEPKPEPAPTPDSEPYLVSYNGAIDMIYKAREAFNEALEDYGGEDDTYSLEPNAIKQVLQRPAFKKAREVRDRRVYFKHEMVEAECKRIREKAYRICDPDAIEDDFE